MVMKMPPIGECKRCGDAFVKTRKDREYCSPQCVNRQWWDDVTSGKRVKVSRPRKAKETVDGSDQR